MTEAQISLFVEDPHQNGLESKLEESPTEREFQREIWARNARIALPRFPELQKGEHVTDREVRRRLNTLKKAGFPVDSYSKISSRERWDLLMSYRSIIWREARRYCPEVVGEIDRLNRAAKEEVYSLR